MIVNVAESGALELFWRHPVSRNPARGKALDFLSQAGQRTTAIAELSGTGHKRLRVGNPEALSRAALAIAREDVVVLEHRSEIRWPGSRMPVVQLSPRELLLSKTSTQEDKNLGAFRHWLDNSVAWDDVQRLWQALWVRYHRSVSPEPLAMDDFRAEMERLVKTGELVPLFHPLPHYVPAVVESAPAGVAPAAAPTPPPLPDPPLFSGEHAPAAQARALQGGSEGGAAFCEVCEKLAKERQQSARTVLPKTWVEIVLLDPEGMPVADEPYEIELPDGSVVTGRTNKSGRARHRNIPEGGCKVRFPELHGQEWEKVQ